MSTSNQNYELEALLDYLKLAQDCDLTGYKRTNLMRRFQNRMHQVGISSYDNYLNYLKVHPDELVSLLNTLLINVTGFFRDRGSWDYLADKIIPQIIERKDKSEPIRVWSAACASGEEAYTLAILLAEALGIKQFLSRVKIYATDVDEAAIGQARLASYSARDVMGIPDGLLEKYFEQTKQRYVFHKDLRRVMIFGRHNLMADAPIPQIDLVVCRNALMYFTAETQAKILFRFHFGVNDNGFLFLGKAETVFTHSTIFIPVDLKHRVFVKVPAELNLQDYLKLWNQTGQKAVNSLAIHLPIWKAAFEHSPVAQIVVDLNGLLTMANEQARLLFGLTPKDVGARVQDLKVFERLELHSCIKQLKIDRRTIILRQVEWSNLTGTSYLDIQVALMSRSGMPVSVSLTCTDVTHYRRLIEELKCSNSQPKLSLGK